MPDDGSVENGILPLPKFYFDTLTETQKAGWPVGEAHIVTTGDTLRSLAQSQYGADRFYGRIAHYNGLHKYRNLPDGMSIYFPPLVEGN